MRETLFTVGKTTQLDNGVEFENGSGLWIEEDEVRIVAGIGIDVWVRRGDSRSGWLVKRTSSEEVTAQSFRTTLQQGDTYLIGDKEFWFRTPEAILADPSGALGSGAIVTVAHTVPEVTHVPVVQQGLQDVPVRAVRKNLKEFFADRLPHRVEEPGFVVNGGETSTDQPVKRKRLMVVGMASLVLLGILTAAGHVRRSSIERATNSQNQTIESIVAQYREAKAVVGIDPGRSRQLVAQAQAAMQTLTGEYAVDSRLTEVKDGIGEVLGQATGTYAVTPTVLIDLHLLREGMEGQQMGLDAGVVWVLDTKGGRIVQVKTDTGAGDVKFSQTTFGAAQLLAVYPGKLYVLSDKGIVECVVATVVCGVKIEKDAEWGNIRSMGAWAGNIYLLDSGKSMIWRYVLGETGFGGKQEWLDTTEGVEQFNLGAGTSLAIDGNLWVMESSSALIKYTRGVGERITLSGLDSGLGNSLDLYTTDEMEGLYILDRDHSRVVKVNKSGGYESQWTQDSLKGATSFVVDEAGGTMWWVNGAKVWSARLVK